MKRSTLGLGVLAGAGAIAVMGAGALGTASTSGGAAQPQDDMRERLVAGLKEIDGCLGVDAASWRSGKSTICAWFEDKDAVERWYYSDTHSGFMGAVGRAEDDHTPLEHVETDGPIMVMATITFAGRPALPGSNIPFSQISIELFEPLPGGAYITERLAPKKFAVPHMRDLTP